MSTANLASVRALIFDLDGTLIDSKRDLILSINATLRELHRTELPEETIAGYVGHGAATLVARALGGNPTEEELKHAHQFFLGYYEEHKTDHTVAYPGVRETLAQLSDWPKAVLTNKPVRMSACILETLGLRRYFRAVYGGNSFQTKKPDPLGANFILRELGMTAQETLFVGDSEVDVQTARNAGMLIAIVNYGFGAHNRSAYPADIYLDCFAELPGVLGNNVAARRL